MQRMRFNFARSPRSVLVIAAAGGLLIAGWLLPVGSQAQDREQRMFSSPGAAASALVAAVRSNDEKKMLEILGPRAKRVVSSGDAVEDASDHANFVQGYQQMHRLVREPDGTTTLYIGAENWPLPIPLVRARGGWYFDTEAGIREILYRRVGRDEVSAMRVCQQLVAAEREYYSMHHDEYAQKIVSDSGRNDGLYWSGADGQAKSPIGPLVARAVATGDAGQRNGTAPVPYRGYYYHILSRQGPNAPSGAKDYFTNGKVTGFAFVAYPAQYRSSGVMTFIVGEDGIIYQKDLGKKTGEISRAMTEYEPDSSWQKISE